MINRGAKRRVHHDGGGKIASVHPQQVADLFMPFILKEVRLFVPVTSKLHHSIRTSCFICGSTDPSTHVISNKEE
uniref:Ovule protein n=1 Tax=Steinernema glaseri TaxID=37863 RepID=A0A1I7ZFB8_9BILA